MIPRGSQQTGVDRAVSAQTHPIDTVQHEVSVADIEDMLRVGLEALYAVSATGDHRPEIVETIALPAHCEHQAYAEDSEEVRKGFVGNLAADETKDCGLVVVTSWLPEIDGEMC